MPAPRILFVSLTNDVGTDRIVAEVERAGAPCAVVSPAGSYAALVRGVAAHFPVSGNSFRATLALGTALAGAVRAWQPDQVVPLDDLSATLLRATALSPRSPIHVRSVLRASFGATAGYDAACQRVALMQVAERSGVRVPAFASAVHGRVDDRIAGELGFPVMVKRDQSSGSGGVVRAETRTRLASALRSAHLKTTAKVALARLARLNRPVTPVLVQQAIDGRLAMFTAVCRDGCLIDGIGFTALRSHPVKRSSTVLQPLQLDEMTDAAQRLVAALGCSGFVSFDFIVDAQDRAFLIEMNPRPIGSAHLGRHFGHDLAHAFVSGEAAPRHTLELPLSTSIALFPKELERDPAGLVANDAGVLHDIPAQEPEVLAAYIRHLAAEHPAHAASFSAYRHAEPPPTQTHVTPMAA